MHTTRSAAAALAVLSLAVHANADPPAPASPPPSVDPAPVSSAAPVSPAPSASVSLHAASAGVFLEKSVPPALSTTLRGRARPNEWDRVCELPCSVPVDPYGSYRIDGPYIAASREFRLAEPSQLSVETGAAWKRNVGVVGIGVGALAIVTSSALFLRASDLYGEADRIDAGPPAGAARATGGAPAFGSTNAESRRDSARTDQTLGFVLLGVGVAALAGGIVALVTYEGTKVTRDAPKSAVRPAADGVAFTF